MKILIKLCVILFALNAEATNYCSKELCRRGRHIACENRGQPGPKCPSNARLINLSADVKQKICSAHNKLRNKIATGNEKPYKSASRMATVTWDNELAYLASLNVLTCRFDHDQCRNTEKFRYAGQNLSMMRSSNKRNYKEFVLDSVQSWYDEHRYANNEIIQQYRSKGGSAYGHFTQVVNDQSYKIGCAVLQYADKYWYTTLFACNYALTNIIGYPIYEFGKPVSKCKTGRNPQYSGLCSVQEKYELY